MIANGLRHIAHWLRAQWTTVLLVLTAPMRLVRRFRLRIAGVSLTPELESQATVVMTRAIRRAFAAGKERGVLGDESEMVGLVHAAVATAGDSEQSLLSAYIDLAGPDRYLEAWSHCWRIAAERLCHPKSE